MLLRRAENNRAEYSLANPTPTISHSEYLSLISHDIDLQSPPILLLHSGMHDEPNCRNMYVPG